MEAFDSREVPRKPGLPSWRFEDLAIAAELLALAPIAWLVPEAHLRSVTLRLARCGARLAPRRTRARRKALARALRHAPETLDPDVLDRHLVAGRLEEMLQPWVELRTAGSRPRVELLGDEHLRAALDAGRGAVLWVAPFFFAGLLVKKAISAVGHPLTHLGQRSHGPTQSRLGVRTVNRLQLGREDRYLAERILIDDEGGLGASRAALRALRDKRLVSISFGGAAHRALDVPLLGAEIRAATGPASLALASGAALLPVSCLPGPEGLTVRIEPPLRTRADIGSRDAVVDLTRSYVSWLGETMLLHPTTCHAFRDLSAPEIPPPGRSEGSLDESGAGRPVR